MITKIDHIGIAVRDLDEAVNTYERIYDLKPITMETLEDKGMRIAFIPVGEVLIELMEPLGPGAGRIGRFIEEKGEGFHHLALRVDHLEEILDRMKRIGIYPDRGPRPGAHGSRVVFIDLAFTGDVLTELVERTQEVMPG